MNDKEIEIQVKIGNNKPLIAFLEKEAEFKKEKHQVDEYFTPSHKDFIKERPVKEWLRLRREGDRGLINYKNWHYDENGKSSGFCDEYETKVEDIDQIEKILKVLDFKSLAVVDKLRKTWTYKDYEIDLDFVKNLGDFVEIEYIGKDQNADPKKITDEMIAFLKNLGCGKIEINYVGYPYQLLFPNETKFEEK
ncbi:MAG: class IV adenylate cyclase [Candidatus Paceibacterota bacterium]|jgi:predicted adenylyl cyclase CyaB